MTKLDEVGVGIVVVVVTKTKHKNVTCSFERFYCIINFDNRFAVVDRVNKGEAAILLL